jgi:hypothetical protein
MNERDLRQVAEIITTLPNGQWDIEVRRRRAKRSNEQNALLWAVYTAIASATGHTPEEIHEACKAMFLPPEVLKLGKREVTVSGSTAQRNVEEFSEYVTQVMAWASSEFGVYV